MVHDGVLDGNQQMGSPRDTCDHRALQGMVHVPESSSAALVGFKGETVKVVYGKVSCCRWKDMPRLDLESPSEYTELRGYKRKAGLTALPCPVLSWGFSVENWDF